MCPPNRIAASGPLALWILASCIAPSIAMAQDVLWALGSDGTLYANPQSTEDQRSFDLAPDAGTEWIVGGRALTSDPANEGRSLLAILTTEPAGGGLQTDSLYRIGVIAGSAGPTLRAAFLCPIWFEGDPAPGPNRDRLDSLMLIDEVAGPTLYGVSGGAGENPNALYRLGAPELGCAPSFVKLLQNAVGGESGATNPANGSDPEMPPTFLRIAGMTPVLSQQVDPTSLPPFRRQVRYIGAPTDQVASLTGIVYRGTDLGISTFLATGVVQSLLELVVGPFGEATLTTRSAALGYQPTGLAVRSSEPGVAYSVGGSSDHLYAIDLANPIVPTPLPIATLTLEGSVIVGASALVADDSDGTLLVALEIQGRTSDRELARITLGESCPDENDECEVSALGSVSPLAGLTFRTVGETTTLFAVTEDNAAAGGFPQLLEIDLSGEAPEETVYTDLGAGGMGEAIAWDPSNDQILHASGTGTINVMSNGAILEWVDPNPASKDAAFTLTGTTPSLPAAATEVPTDTPTEPAELEVADTSGLLLLTEQMPEEAMDLTFDGTLEGTLNQPVTGIAYAVPEPGAGSLAALLALCALARQRRSTLRT